jgi:hypothetical protein
MSEQSNWRWCNKCQVLAFAGSPSLGACAAGGSHDHTGSGDYLLTQNVTDPGRQANWRWCNKCQVLAFAGSPSLGACAAGGSHDHTGSGDYLLTQNVTSQPGWQSNWRWCNKCQVLAFAGNPSLGACAAGGSHDHTGSGNYQLEFVPSDLTITPTSIVFSQHINLEGLDVGSIQGPVSVTMKSDGSYDFNVQLNNSAFLPYNFSVLVVLKSENGTAFTFAVSNSIGAGIPFSNNNFLWDNNGNNGTIKNVWGDLQAGCTYYYKAAASVDISTLWEDLSAAIGVVSTVVSVVGSL